MIFSKLSDQLDKLRPFLTVAESRTLREAAVKLHMSQPALTRLIQNLEDAVGTHLFHRSRQGVTLTHSGQMLFSYACRVLKDLEDLEQRFKSPDTEHAGLLRIGSYESLSEYLWPEVIRDLKKSNPELKLNIRTSNGQSHYKSLESGDLDILVDAEPRLLEDFTSWTLYQDRFNFYSEEFKDKTVLSPEMVNDSKTLIYCPQAFDRDNKAILQHLGEHGFFFKERIELDSFTAVRTFCKAGLGIGVLPQRLAGSELKKTSLKGFSLKGFGAHNICASIKTSQKNDPRIKFFIKYLKDRFRSE